MCVNFYHVNDLGMLSLSYFNGSGLFACLEFAFCNNRLGEEWGRKFSKEFLI